MTNKLPEVGKRYREKSEILTVDSIRIKNDETWILFDDEATSINLKDFWKCYEELPDSQKKPKVQLSESIILEVKKAKEDLKEELRWWNAIILKYTEQMITQRDMAKVTRAAQNLIDALEGGKNQEETKKESDELPFKDEVKRYVAKLDKIDPEWRSNGKPIPKEKPQSIWKPVSELPTDEKLSVIVELESGEKCFSTYTKEKGFTEIDGSKIGSFYGRPYQFGFSPKEIRFCTLTDFINDIEQTKLDHEERLRKLEGK